MASPRALAAAIPLALGACGGGSGGSGGDAWLFPLWVPTDIVVVDLDGDGRADVLTCAQYAASSTQREGRLVVHRQLAGGGFAAGETLPVGRYPWRMAIADVDGDGARDVVLADVEDDAVYWLRQDGASPGHFLAPVPIATGVHPYDVVVADFTADGVADVAIADSQAGSQRLVLLPQEPAARGQFAAPRDVPLPGATTALDASDLDGDARTDLAAGFVVKATVTDFDTSLATLPQQGGGGLGAAQVLASAHALNLRRLRIADHDGDGRPDLVAFLGASDDSTVSEILAVLRLPGGGTRVIATPLAGVQGIDDAAFADFDGDGRLDAAVAGFYPEGSPSTVKARLNLFRQDPAGAEVLATSISMPAAVSRIASGDVDGDGRVDLVLLADQDQVLWVRQSPAQPGTFLAPQALP
ncbi:MAG: VCBS repeat-containing protein [Steroidobacteraceae bacterium]